MAKYRKLGRTSSQRKALIRNQVTALLNNGKIVTTEAKAKEIRKVAEGLIAMYTTKLRRQSRKICLQDCMPEEKCLKFSTL